MRKRPQTQTAHPNIFAGSTLTVAKRLLGCRLIHETADGRTAGIIVETEAYLRDDQASHSFRGQTPRNTPMFGPAGTVYVYFTYGMHHCFNVVTNRAGVGEAVLIRALEPIEGIEIMRKRREVEDLQVLCSGPAKLVEAMGITKAHNGTSLLDGPLRIEARTRTHSKITTTTRIGIKRGSEHLYRFCIADNSSVSVNTLRGPRRPKKDHR
ncbi:MAG: DNA-3-methyladenine glycosylase [Nanoarchaeota archaeon]